MKTKTKKTTIMTSITIATLLIASSSFMGMQNASAMDIVTNGSFEDGANTCDGAFETVFSVSTEVNDWSVDSGSVDWICSYWDPSDGTNSLDMSGNGPGSISQDLSTEIGAIYLVTFDMSGNDDGGNAVKSMTVSAAADTEDFTANEGANNAMNYQPKEFVFTATSTTTTLTFTSNEANAYGPALDNVTAVKIFDQKECNDDTGLEESICKSVLIEDESGNGIISVGEKVTYTFVIDAVNNDVEDWLNVVVTDNFGGDLAVADVGADLTDWQHPQLDVLDFEDNLDCVLNQTGKKAFKEHLTCPVADDTNLDVDESASVGVTAETDYNHGQSKKYMKTGGEQGTREYTSCGVHSPNSGAVISYFLAEDDQEVDDPRTLETAAVYVDVFEFEDLSLGDCDEDGLPDDVDPEPFVFNDEDGDGVGDGFDVCPGVDDNGDADLDGLVCSEDPDDTDACIPDINDPLCLI